MATCRGQKTVGVSAATAALKAAGVLAAPGARVATCALLNCDGKMATSEMPPVQYEFVGGFVHPLRMLPHPRCHHPVVTSDVVVAASVATNVPSTYIFMPAAPLDAVIWCHALSAYVAAGDVISLTALG